MASAYKSDRITNYMYLTAVALNRYFDHPGKRAAFEREMPDDEILLSRDERYEYLRQPYQKG